MIDKTEEGCTTVVLGEWMSEHLSTVGKKVHEKQDGLNQSAEKCFSKG